MFAMQYSHRLAADHDMQGIRQRAARRGPLWDDTPGLAFKAFVSQERGVTGALLCAAAALAAVVAHRLAPLF